MRSIISSKVINVKHKMNILGIKNRFFKLCNFQFCSQPVNPKKQAKIDEVKAGIPEFKEFEKQTRRDLLEKLKVYKKDAYYHYGSVKGSFQSKTYNKTEFFAKSIRQSWFRAGDLPSHKHIIPIKRLRKPDETLFKLLQRKEIAAVIEGREEFPDFDFVLDSSLVKNLTKNPMYHVKPFYLKFNNDEIRCTLIQKEKLPDGRPFKIRFQRYIVGRPNLLRFELRLVGKHLNRLIQDFDCEVAQYYYHVDLWCKNDDYPGIIEIDSRLVLPKQAFKFLDLSLMLPEGMWLHRKYDRVMYNAIAGMDGNYNSFLADTLYPLESLKRIENAGEDENMEGYLANTVDELKETKPVVKKKKPVMIPINVASSKKIMQIKDEGGNAKALREFIKKGGSSDKKKGKKPEKKSTPPPTAATPATE